MRVRVLIVFSLFFASMSLVGGVTIVDLIPVGLIYFFAIAIERTEGACGTGAAREETEGDWSPEGQAGAVRPSPFFVLAVDFLLR